MGKKEKEKILAKIEMDVLVVTREFGFFHKTCWNCKFGENYTNCKYYFSGWDYISPSEIISKIRKVQFHNPYNIRQFQIVF